MATLVLTAVGSAVGGPIGGAIGALIGQSVDHALFGPKRREGPRLVELAVQTSSYGAQIPKLFGTMRVAGTVIWATDLIESRASSRSGKGQPGVSTYSYAASFAVLLSARAIRSVGRIWAEGKLLRGAGGDFKTATGFRLHLGGEDQAVDPLIASAEGAATPAYRGAAYAVFEMLQLADFGNRIPSLTFEVIADEGVVLVSTIAKALAGEVSGTAALAVGGFAASGGSVRVVLEMLGQAGGAWFAPSGAGLVMRDVAGATVVVADEGFAVDAVVGATIVHAFEVPGLDDTSSTGPRMTVVAAGTGAAWRQAALLYSLDDGVSWVAAGATAAPEVLGTIAVVAPGAPAALVDQRGVFEVVLAHADMELGDADAAALDRGVNLALLGDELVQFGRAEPMGAARWRLSQLLRGRRGTEASAGAQLVGDRFVVLEAEAARAFDLPVTVLGREVRVIASGVGDDMPVETRCTMRGASVVPPSPVHLWFASEVDGSATVGWTRRSRAGWRWIDGVDAPLAEEIEAYRVTVTAGGTSRDVDVADPLVSVTAADRVGAVSIAVRQRGVFGESLAASLIVPALIVSALIVPALIVPA